LHKQFFSKKVTQKLAMLLTVNQDASSQ